MSRMNGSRSSVSRRRTRCSGKADGRLDDGPIEETAEDPDEVVEAASPMPWARRHEPFQQRTGQLAQSDDAVLVGEAEEQAKGRLLGQILASKGTLVGEEVVDGDRQVVVHPNTASPSPRATSRSASTATLA